ncbi:MAG: TonB-dependent receptor [Bacteroidales bacterium]|nr:TonB-dependent receptor [Bacteroidales bacterium]
MKKILFFILLLGLSIPMTAQVTVQGTVKSAQDGSTLPGVSILLKGTTRGTVTNMNGHYSISVPGNATLIFSFVGFETKDIVVKNEKTINVSLNTKATGLNQVVVVGYGTEKRKDLTSSIATISGAKIANQAVGNALTAVQGRLAGVQITNDGAPGSAPTIRIRGTGSIYSSTPLYVVDGVIVNDISYLGPNDIASISVLRDASAAAIYGVQAANGVILITTKKGTRNGKVKVFFNSYVGIKKPSHIMQMNTTAQWIQMYNERIKYSNSADSLLNPANFPTSTNWFNQVLTSSVTHNVDVSVMGGGKNSSFNIGVDDLKDNGLIKGNNYERLDLRANYGIHIGRHVSIGLTTVLSSSKTNPAPGNLLLTAFRSNPMFAPKSNDTTYTDPTDINGFYPLPQSNPAAMLYYNHQWNNTINAYTNGYIKINFLKNFELKSTMGFNPTINNYIGFTPIYQVSTSQQSSYNTLTKTNSYNTNLSWDNTLTYTKTIKDEHHISVMMGTTYREFTSNYLSGTATGIVDLPEINPSYLFLTIGKASSKTTIVASDGGSKVVEMGYMGRFHYDYKNRYLVNFTMRADASSKFPANNRWGYFPSVGFGWIISQEKFMKRIPAINFLKLRAGWGLLGNANIPSNLYQPTISNGTPVIFGPDQNTGYGPVSPSENVKNSFNPNLKWEVVEETDAGFDLNALNNRLTASFDWYYKLTNNAIFATTALASSGLNSSGVWGNFANILNKGLELTVGWQQKVGAFNFNINVNGSYNQNVVKSISAAGASYYDAGDGSNNITPITRTTVGQPIGEFFGYKVIGVFQNQAQIDATPHLQGTVPGDLIFADINHDGVIDATDRTSIGNPNPPYLYGVNLGVNYKNFDLNIFCQGVAGNKIFNENRLLEYVTENFDQTFYNNRWHGQGTSNTYPSVLINAGDPRTPSSYYIESGSYFRVKNIQLAYNFSKNIISRLHLEKLRIYVNAENPFTFFKYNGFSPEVASNSPLLSGVDNGVYPLSSIYTFGVSVTY